MWYGHRRRANGRLAIDFLAVLTGDFRVLRHQERAANREACVVIRFRNAGFLQQLQRAAACADEHIFRVHGVLFPAVYVGYRDVPGVIGVAFKIGNFRGSFQLEVAGFFQAAHQLTGDFAVVDVGADRRPGRSDFLLRIAAFNNQRCPFFDLLLIGRELHSLEQRGLLQRLVTFGQVLHIFIAPDKAHVRRGVNKGMRIIKHTALHLRRPELTRNHKRFIDFQRFGHVNRTVFTLRRIVQLHVRGVAGACVIPAVGRFKRHAVQFFHHQLFPVWLDLLKDRTERRAHDAAANQQDIGFFRGVFRISG
ncbi:hypothetical protein BN128_3285 [Cronobacter sakazakii 696]|nr:hypothetical protein BN128_3285 [Cronobacter sakazakii 696]